jgi:hypothetical protein
MNTSTEQSSNHLLHWIAAVLLISFFALSDTAVIAWSASLVSAGQLAAAGTAFVSLSAGVLFTVWQLKR